MLLRTSVHPSLANALLAGLLTCLAGLGAMLALAVPADAGVRTFRPGVVNGTVPDAAELGSMRNIGAGSVRIVFSWDVIETRPRVGSSCGTAIYNFSRHDTLVSEAGRRGVSILPVLMDSTRATGQPSTRYPAPGTRAFGDFQCFVRAVVDRYGRGGSFGRDITEWQVWNEPNLPLYNPGGNVSPTKYGQLVKATSQSIRSQDSRATVVLAGLPEETKRGMNSNAFLRKLYSVNKIRSKFDVVALHPYAENARGTKGALIRLREQLRKLGDRRRPVWVTEIGYATDGQKGYFLVTGEKGQATKLEETMRMLRKNRDRFKLGTVHWFNFRDIASYSQNTNNWADYAGLFRKDGTPKPSCVKYKRFTGAGTSCSRIPPDQPAPLDAGSTVLSHPDAQLVPSEPE